MSRRRPRQLNIYVPKERAGLLKRLDERAKRLGQQKNEIVLAALDAYLGEEKPKLGTYNLGVFEVPTREELYGEYLDEKYARLEREYTGREGEPE